MKTTKNNLKRLINAFLNEQLDLPSGEEIDQQLISFKNKFGEAITEDQYEKGITAWAEIYDGTVSIIRDMKEMIPSVISELTNLVGIIPEQERKAVVTKLESMLTKLNNSGTVDAFLSYGVLDSEKVVRSSFTETLTMLSAPGESSDKGEKALTAMLASGPTILSAIKDTLDSLLEGKPEADESGEYAMLDTLSFLYRSAKMFLNIGVEMTETSIDTQYLFGAMELSKFKKQELVFLKLYYFLLKTARDIFLLPENLLRGFLSAVEKGSIELSDPASVKINVLDNL